MSAADGLRKMAQDAIAGLDRMDGLRTQPQEAKTVIAALLAVLDVYEPIVERANETAEDVLRRLMKIIEMQPRWDCAGMDMEMVIEGEYLDRGQLIEAIMDFEGYEEVEGCEEAELEASGAGKAMDRG